MSRTMRIISRIFIAPTLRMADSKQQSALTAIRRHNSDNEMDVLQLLRSICPTRGRGTQSFKLSNEARVLQTSEDAGAGAPATRWPTRERGCAILLPASCQRERPRREMQERACLRIRNQQRFVRWPVT
jgi:hypothetical protein